METVQGSLFPFSSSANVLLTLERIHRRVTRLGPDLGPPEFIQQLSELALFESLLDKQELYARHMAEIKARRLGILA
jgi:hypothetical protein